MRGKLLRGEATREAPAPPSVEPPAGTRLQLQRKGGAPPLEGIPEGAPPLEGIPEGALPQTTIPEGALPPVTISEGALAPRGILEGALALEGVPEGVTEGLERAAVVVRVGIASPARVGRVGLTAGPCEWRRWMPEAGREAAMAAAVGVCPWR